MEPTELTWRATVAVGIAHHTITLHPEQSGLQVLEQLGQ
jgi:hypothetical protein